MIITVRTAKILILLLVCAAMVYANEGADSEHPPKSPFEGGLAFTPPLKGTGGMSTERACTGLPTRFFRGLKAQTSTEAFPRMGLVRAQATFTPSYFLKDNIQPIYLHGELSFFMSEHASINSDSYWLIGYQNDRRDFRHHHSLFTGGAYHLPTGKFDPYISFQPGIAVTELETYVLQENQIVPDGRQLKVSPLLSCGAGFNFYVGRFLHFFLNLRYVNGKYLHATDPLPLHELRISAGLGWNVHLIRKQ